MATMNPLERKARSSFIKGILLAGIIGIIGIVVLIIQIIGLKGEEKKRLDSMITIYVLNQDVQSGQIITADMMTSKKIEGSVIPTNAVKDISNYFLQDQNGNTISTMLDDQGNAVLVDTIDGQNYAITENNGAYYINRNGNNEQISVLNDEGATMMAKVAMAKNTILTSETVAKSDELTDNTTRTQEFNMLGLPADIETDDIVDVRLRMPDGTDYIVVSKKKVTVLDEGGIPSINTISLNLSESEILMMSNAIVEAYQIPGSKIYVSRYVEPGLQAQAAATYVPNSAVQNLIYTNPNIVNEAKTELNRRYNENVNNRNNVNNTLGGIEQDDKDQAIETKTNEEVTAGQDERQKYLDSLSE